MTQNYQARLHYGMSFIGGFFGLYALYNRSEIFGSALTANMLSMLTGLIGHNLLGFAIRLGAVILYASAIVLAILLPKYTACNMQRISILCTLCAAVILGLLPAQMNPVIALYPVFFVMALQWNVFQGAYGYTSSCIFSSNNFRQFISGLTEYASTGDTQQRTKARFFGYTLLAYHAGAAICFILSTQLHTYSIWCCIPVLFVLFAAVCYHSQASHAM